MLEADEQNVIQYGQHTSEILNLQAELQILMWLSYDLDLGSSFCCTEYTDTCDSRLKVYCVCVTAFIIQFVASWTGDGQRHDQEQRVYILAAGPGDAARTAALQSAQLVKSLPPSSDGKCRAVKAASFPAV